MTTELEQTLVKQYSKILCDYKGDMMQTCMAWGMECDDGWFELLENCLKKMQYACDVFSKDGREVQVIADQIKEKYGSLRFYYHVNGANDIESDIIDDIANEAERKSHYTCEITGKDGVACSYGGWFKTLCRTKAKELGYKACDPDTEKYWQEKNAKEQKSSNS